ncbi:glycosyltransferase family 1 protein [Rhodococcus kroppenstedtii]|uniref:glycosyltransferase family 1 protein n=1 Tax=Rhodococcoides kroppenstedtii TaxID=293050 RepID=UPI002953826C|nr:glycosyltransferase family 1 protein [Rhodococcus kroppenstedtii]MDV7198333.1 glycosyltransferase family 1 protein [Rhodococcus kroppenstedtii]
MPDLANTSLVYVAPAAGKSGVGDYADDFLAAVAPRFREVIDYRIDTEGAESAADVVRHVRTVRALAKKKSAEGPTIVHFEQSGGSLSVFWASLLPRDIPVTATVHDPPFQVWWPFKTRFVGQHRLVHHAIHYPFKTLTRRFQRRVIAGRTVFTLTGIGAEVLGQKAPESNPVASRIFVPARRDLKPLSSRPVAVGLFGHVYRGKGFDLLGALRERIDPDVGIIAAGRGTAALPPVDGVTLLGEVNGPDEDYFFESIRLLLVPYSKHSQYGKAYPASSAVTRSYAYGTPIVCIMDGALGEAVDEGGAYGVERVEQIAEAVNSIVRDDVQLEKLGDQVAVLRVEHDLDHCVVPFLEAWERS